MNAYILKKGTPYTAKVDDFDHGMFHGLGSRKLSTPQASRHHLMYTMDEDIPRFPLHLTRNIRVVPKTFMPNLSFVVLDGVKNLLNFLPKEMFLEAILDEPFDFDVGSKGRAQFRTSKWKRDIDGFIGHIQLKARVDSCALRFWEIVPFWYGNAAKGATNMKRIELFIGPQENGEKASIELSPRLIERAPVLLHPQGFYVINTAVFNAIEADLDRRYFLISKVKF